MAISSPGASYAGIQHDSDDAIKYTYVGPEGSLYTIGGLFILLLIIMLWIFWD